jgi:hypothetical protein
MDKPARDVRADEAVKNPFIRKIKDLGEFVPDQNAIDVAASTDEGAVVSALRRKLRVGEDVR